MAINWSQDPRALAYAPQVNAASAKYGVPTSVIYQQIGQESSWNTNAVTGNAVGLAQIMPGTATDPGYGIAPVSNRNDPNQSIDFAAHYTAALYGKTGSWSGAMDAYGTTAGQGANSSAVMGLNQSLADAGYTNTTPPGTVTQASGGALFYSKPGDGPIAGLTPGANSAVQGTDAANNGSASGKTVSALSEWFTRIAIGLTALLFIGAAVYAISKEGAIVSTVKKAVA